MRRLLVALCLLAASASVAQTPDRPGRDVDGDVGPFVAEIEYGEPSGALRHAALTLTPTAADGTPPWNGDVASVVVVSDKGTWHVVDRLLSSGHQTGVVRAEALLPAPEAVVLLLLRSTRDPWRGWRLRDAEGYANQEVSYVDQRGRPLRSGPCAPDDCLAHVEDAGDRVGVTASSLRLAVGTARR